MTVTPACLIPAQYAPASQTALYTVPAGATVIIDSLTATNTDASTRTVTINLVPSGGAVDPNNLISDAVSITASANNVFAEMKSQILQAGDAIYVEASVASKVVVRASGRVCT